MPQISRIEHLPNEHFYKVYVDNEFCCKVRERIFPAVEIQVGSEITCKELREREKYHWKFAYGPKSWEEENVRLRAVTEFISNLDSELRIKAIGFGAGKVEFIAAHPDEPGAPDLEVSYGSEERRLMLVEVTGTINPRGGGYWIRPDKLKYAANHPEEDIWIILHFSDSGEGSFVFIKPDRGRKYPVSPKNIRGATELYVIFNSRSPEFKSYTFFKEHLLAKI